MKIRNSQGHIVEVPRHLEKKVKKHIKDGNHHLVTNVMTPHMNDNPPGMHEGPTDYGNGVQFGFGGQTGRTPEGDIISSIGQGAYLGQMGRKMRRGGRMYDEGGLKSSSGNFDFGNSNATQYTAPSTQTYEMSPQQTTSGSALPQQQTLNQPSSNYGSYINAGMSVGQGLQNWGNTNNNPNLTKDQKNNANTYNAVDTTVNTVGAFVPAVGIIKGAADMGKGVVDSTNPNTTTVDPSTGKSYTYKGGANGDNAAAWKASYDPVGNVTNGIGSFTGSTENYGNDNIGMGVLDFAAPFISAGLRNKGAREAGEAAKYNIPNKGNIIQNSVNNNYDNSYLAGSKGIANGQVARLGGRVRRMANGGPVQQIPGGTMVNEGPGIQGAYGASHEQGGMQLDGQSEIEGGEKVLNNDYVLTDQPNSQPMMKESIARRFDKNNKALSKRNSTEQKNAATEKLKGDAMANNDIYLNEQNAILSRKMDKVMAKYGGHLKKYQTGGNTRTDYGLDPEYQANAEQQLGSNWANILGLHNINPTGDYGDYDQGRPQTTRLPISTPQSPVIAPQSTSNAPVDFNYPEWLKNHPRTSLGPNTSPNFVRSALDVRLGNPVNYNGTTGGNQPFGLYSWGNQVPTNNPNNPGEPANVPPLYEMDPEQTRNGSNYFGPSSVTPSGQPRANGYSSNETNTYNKTKREGYTPDAGLLRYLPAIAHGIGYLSKAEHINPSKYNTKIGNAKHVSDDASRRQNLGDYYTALYALKNSGNYSGRSQVALMRERMKADDKSVEWKNNTNAGIDNEYLSKVLANDQSNKKNEAYVDALNSQAKANKNLYGQQTALDLGNIGEEAYIRKNYPEYYKKNKARRGGRLAKSIFKY